MSDNFQHTQRFGSELCSLLQVAILVGICLYRLFIEFKKAKDSVRSEVLYSILMGLGVSMKLARLIKIRLNKTYSKVRVCEHLIIFFSKYHKKEML
jgi:hypothetical protein